MLFCPSADPCVLHRNHSASVVQCLHCSNSAGDWVGGDGRNGANCQQHMRAGQQHNSSTQQQQQQHAHYCCMLLPRCCIRATMTDAAPRKRGNKLVKFINVYFIADNVACMTKQAGSGRCTVTVHACSTGQYISDEGRSRTKSTTTCMKCSATRYFVREVMMGSSTQRQWHV